MGKDCFVVMPIGDQQYGDFKISASELRAKYDDLIRDAILLARPDLEVTRADDVQAPGSITNDIFTRLMHSSYVVADISYPNPNVFYELGIRHAIRPGCILIKEKLSMPTPFDISHLRYIEYENTATGLKALVESFRSQFSWHEKNSQRPDNQFLELAKLTKYEYPQYAEDPEAREEARSDMMSEILLKLMQSPELMHLMMDSTLPEAEKNKRIVQELSKNPEVAGPLIKMMTKSKLIEFD